VTWGVFSIIGLGLFLTYVIWQETRSHLQWRGLVERGNVWAIRELVTTELNRWRRIRPPTGVPASVWAGVQTLELVSIGENHIQVACGTEAEYRMAAGRRELVTSAIEAAMRLDVRVTEMVLYDIPEVKIDTVRVDVYSTFASPDGSLEQRCILTTEATRQMANEIDWEALSNREIVERFSSRFEVDDRGNAYPIDPGPPLPDESDGVSLPEEVQRSRSRGSHPDSRD
jgi:hypothetical protein